MSTEARIWRMLAITSYVCAVPKVCAQLGWLQADDAEEWNVFWSDQSISLARAVAMQPMQVLMVAYLTLSLMHACGVPSLCFRKFVLLGETSQESLCHALAAEN